MEWIHDEYSVVEKHAQTMLQLLDSVCVVYFGKPGDLEQIVNVPVSHTDCGRDRRGEQILDCVEQYPEPIL